MSLVADAEAIRRYADAIAMSSQHAATARDYANRYGHLPPEDVGLISAIRGDHERFSTTLDETLSRLSNVLRASGQELTKVANFYAATNDTAATALDATYPASLRPAIGAS